MTTNAVKQKQLILIVDDDASIRITASGILELMGYSILNADSGAACLETCSRQIPDLILLDAVMPGIDGFACALQLKKLLGLQCPPIFMMTALDDLESIYRSIDIGINDYLVKPLIWSDLAAKIEQAAINRSKTEELKRQFEEIYSLKEKLNDSINQVKNRRRYA
ncbi:MAG: response regulator [Cyanobacteria bacterium J06621_8]